MNDSHLTDSELYDLNNISLLSEYNRAYKKFVRLTDIRDGIRSNVDLVIAGDLRKAEANVSAQSRYVGCIQEIIWGRMATR